MLAAGSCRKGDRHRIFDFVQQYSLVDSFQEMSPEQIQVTALFLNNLRHKPLKRIHVSERLDFLQKKRAYTPAADVESSEVPHFLKMASAHPAHSAGTTCMPAVWRQLRNSGCSVEACNHAAPLIVGV